MKKNIENNYIKEEMQKIIHPNIPQLKPFQFDNYLFDEALSPKNGLYDRFHIERIEIYKNHLKIPVLPHRRSVYFFLFITVGSAIRCKGLTDYEISAGDFFCLSADQITSIEYISDDIDGFYCHFVPDIFNIPQLKINIENDFSFFGFNAEPVIKNIDSVKILPLLTNIFNEYRSNIPSRFELIPLYLTTIFKEILLNYEKPDIFSINASYQLTQKYKNALSSFIYEKKSVQEYAEFLSVSPNHLHKSVKLTTGKSAHNLLDDMRVLEAKVLLRQSNLSIAEIAYKIGCFEPSDFSRFFKKQTKLSPKEYRLTMID